MKAATNISQETLSDVVKINLSDIAEYAHMTMMVIPFVPLYGST